MPITLRESLGKVLSGLVEFVMPSNQKWGISYERNCSSFICLKEFVIFYGLEENYIVLFEYLGYSCFFVRIFDKSSREISYLKLCKTLKSYDILLTSEYQFGFVKRNVCDVSWIANIKELLDKYYEGDMFISFMKERHILDRFVIVLACPRSDRKFNNVYIGSLARQFSNDWINGASSILIAHQRQWRVVVKFKHNMCKLGIGWDKYSRDNDLGEGDICVFNLLKYDRKIFRVDVIRS
ncbi:uncharacterized protein LOC141697967 isoform X1 [Apium graveolens]|uniref:uncharacterized protein LOC141697967 isoform X1 n=1 Tax=Apium graveolens TaxID=4045 RepID=UPI003D7AA0B8